MNAGRFWRWLAYTVCGLVAIYLIAPMLIVVIISFSSSALLTFPPPGFSWRWYQNLVTTPAWRESFTVSLEVMTLTALLATTLGTMAAVGLAGRRTGWLAGLRALLMAPLVVPQIVSAAGIFLLLDACGWVGTIRALVTAHTVLAIPYVVATVGAALETTDPGLVPAALTLGATPSVAFRRITLPLIRPGILSGLLFAAVLSFDELIVSLFLSTPRTRTVTVQMWSNVFGDIDPAITAIATLILLVSMLLLAAYSLIGRRRGAGSVVMPL
jgi:putative spermidine/putrescine transport system permease protein